MLAANSKDKPTLAGWQLGLLGKLCAEKAGNANANEPQESQWGPFWAVSLLASTAMLTPQIPPSLPVRTSSASADAGATSAAHTAIKLSKAATRLHKGNVDGVMGLVTPRL